jgi:hypothetical protein
MEIFETVKLAEAEAKRAEDKYKRPYASEHEFYGVLIEEIEELWDEIKKKDEIRDYELIKKECIQCISVIMRYLKQI